MCSRSSSPTVHANLSASQTPASSVVVLREVPVGLALARQEVHPALAHHLVDAEVAQALVRSLRRRGEWGKTKAASETDAAWLRKLKKPVEDYFTVFTLLKIFSSASRLFSLSFLEIQ